jgi:hypothetical protein
LGQSSHERYENCAFADAENKSADHHEFVGFADRRQGGAQHANCGCPERHPSRSKAVDEQSVHQGKRDIGDADDAIQHAD